MTAAQLTHLAELAAYAAGFFVTTDPNAARTFGDAAIRADTLSTELHREEEQACQATVLAVIRPEVTSGISL